MELFRREEERGRVQDELALDGGEEENHHFRMREKEETYQKLLKFQLPFSTPTFTGCFQRLWEGPWPWYNMVICFYKIFQGKFFWILFFLITPFPVACAQVPQNLNLPLVTIGLGQWDNRDKYLKEFTFDGLYLLNTVVPPYLKFHFPWFQLPTANHSPCHQKIKTSSLMLWHNVTHLTSSHLIMGAF